MTQKKITRNSIIDKMNLKTDFDLEKGIKNDSEKPIREFPEFTPIQEKFLVQYRNGMNIDSIVKTLKISRSTVYSWRVNVPDFQICMEDAMDQYMGSLSDRAFPITLACFRLIEETLAGNYLPHQKSEVVKIALKLLKALKVPLNFIESNDNWMKSIARKIWDQHIVPYREQEEKERLSNSVSETAEQEGEKQFQEVT